METSFSNQFQGGICHNLFFGKKEELAMNPNQANSCFILRTARTTNLKDMDTDISQKQSLSLLLRVVLHHFYMPSTNLQSSIGVFHNHNF